MSKIIDITNKLNFEEKPIIKVKDVEVAVNNEATTILEVMAITEDAGNNVNSKNVYELVERLFDEENQKKLNSLKLNFEDFVTFIAETIKMVNGADIESEGETVTPATT